MRRAKARDADVRLPQPPIGLALGPGVAQWGLRPTGDRRPRVKRALRMQEYPTAPFARDDVEDTTATIALQATIGVAAMVAAPFRAVNSVEATLEPWVSTSHVPSTLPAAPYDWP